MKKLSSFLSLALVLLLMFACDLQVPKAIQIKGNPGLNFAIKEWEFDPFSDIIDSAFDSDSNDKLEIFECTNDALRYKTFLVRMELFNEPIELEDHSGGGSITTITVNGEEYEIDANLVGDTIELKDRVDLASSDEPVKLPFSGLGDDLDGFKFKEDDIKSKIYIYGSEIVTAITVELKGDIVLPPSSVLKNYELPDNVHTMAVLPDGGIDVEFAPLINSDGDVEISYEIYFAKGEVIKTDWLGDEHPIKAELVIWIPLELEAVEDNAEIKFPYFEGMGSFFTSMSKSGYIKSIDFSIGMKVNPFKEGTLVIRDIDTNYEITNPMTAEVLNFALSEDHVKHINDNPFDPKFSIRFERGEVLGIPKTFNITTVSLNIGLEYTKEF